MFFARPMKNQDFRFEWHKFREGRVIKQEDFSNCNIKKITLCALKILRVEYYITSPRSPNFTRFFEDF